MYKFHAKIFVFISLLFVCNQVVATEDASLYAVDVLVVNESADTRWRVLKEGLDEVFIRLSGDSIVMNKLKRPPASRFVKQYSYGPVENPGLDKNGEVLAHRLTIQYNGSAMKTYLRDNGYPVWGDHRADVVVWLAIRDGQNEYVLKDADESLLKSTTANALHRRGIPERWPLYDYKDRKILKVADIRGGFKDPVVMASKRYSRGPALTGSLIWNGEKWQSSWSLLMASGDRHWSIVDADYNKLINKSIDKAADTMGAIFAIREVSGDQQQVTVQLDIQAVNSIKKYRKIENYLRDLAAVEMTVPLMVDGDSAVFEVTLRSSEADFFNLIKNDAELVKVRPVEVEPLETTPVNDVPVQPMANQGAVTNNQTGVDKTTNVVTATSSRSETGDLQNQPGNEPQENKAPQTPVYHYKFIN